MTPDQLQSRATQFTLRVIKLVRSLPYDIATKEIGRQLVRSGMSVSANYRASRRTRSQKEFVAKLGIVVEETDETVHWLELLAEADIIEKARLTDLISESNELLKIFASSRATAKRSLDEGREPKSQNHPITKLSEKAARKARRIKCLK